MQCPICSSELADNAIACDKCGALRSTRRTPMGVMVGWLGMIAGLIWIMAFIPILILPFIGFSLKGYPWAALILGGIAAVGMLYYSRSTQHPEWIPREN